MLLLDKEFSVCDFVSSMSEAVDLVSQDLSNHHKKVAYISYNLAKEMNLSDIETRDIVLAAILHDIGAFTGKERLQVKMALFEDSEYDFHAIMGYKLLRRFGPLQNAATLIRYHHTHYGRANMDIPIGSYIIHLADRIAVLLDERSEVLEQVPEILIGITENQTAFHPDTLLALNRLINLEYFWIEACSRSINDILPDRIRLLRRVLDLDTLRNFAKVISYIIDFRSRFTSTHSAGVAAVAKELTRIYNFSERECKLMEIAGFLHDLGKLAVDDSILEKNGALDHQEFNTMRKHSYYTYVVLRRVSGLEQIVEWASYHHERLDGKGYPFHVKGSDFSKLSRIMCVADILTAITEDRPYRAGMDSIKAIDILTEMVENGGIDQEIVEVVKENFAQINTVRIEAQAEALRDYKEFYSSVD